MPDKKNTNVTVKQCVTDKEYLYPRCEYYTRFEETSFFKMDEYSYWNTYHRSEEARFSKLVKPHCYKANELYHYQNHSPFAHSGSYKNPYDNAKYQNQMLKFEQHHLPIKTGQTQPLYNELLEYRKQLCDRVVSAFEEAIKDTRNANLQDLLHQSKYYERKLVYIENDYPCVMVYMPFTNLGWLGVTRTEHARFPDSYEAISYWQKYPRPLQILLMAYYVAIADYQAYQADIPIEIVMRSSFGHLLPSVSETETAFRINTGIVPVCYAEILGQSLAILYKTFASFDKKTEQFEMTSKQEMHLKKYNHRNKKTASQAKKEVKLEGTVWEVLRQYANSKGGSLLREITRSQVVVELLANFVLTELITEEIDIPTEQGIVEILKYLDFDKTVTFKSVKGNFDPKSELWKKRTWPKNKPVSEHYFWEMINKLLQNLQVPPSDAIRSKSILGIYSYLEQAHVTFIARAVQNAPKDVIDEMGCDSECDGQINETRLHAKKLTTTTGMMAIGCAYFAAQYYLKRYTKISSANVSFNTMYFEINEALKLAKDYRDLKMAINPKQYVGSNYVLFYDLNYCNAANLPSLPLKEMLQKQKPKVVILDSTSATTVKVNAALTTVLTTTETKDIKLIIIVSSGLKHEAGGSDNNPYGTLRIFSPNLEITDGLYEALIKCLKKDKNYISTTAHHIRRQFKESQFVPRNKHFFDETDD